MMTHFALLRDVEEFLLKDLANEKLSSRTNNRRNTLLSKVSTCIKNEKEMDKTDEFLARQREVSRLQSENERSKTLPTKLITESDDEDDGGAYMDLTDGRTPDFSGTVNTLHPSAPRSCGSGSGYESYASDEETAATRTKSNKEEDLDPYFSTLACDIYTYIYLEIKNKFLSGKKWTKRVGVVTENHLKCYKKPEDAHAVLDIPLRAYTSSLTNKEGTTSVIVTLSAGSDSEAHRFYVERDKVDEWTRVLREKTTALTASAVLSPPPIVARPPSTLARAPPPPQPNAQLHSPLLRTASSTGMSGRSKSVGDISIIITDTSSPFPPPFPPGHPTPLTNNNIGKGLKSNITDRFKKKEKRMKKRISSAENLGADVCGHLSVFDGKWTKKWCLVKWNQLFIYGKEEEPEIKVQLSGCDLLPYFDDPERNYAFKLLRDGKEIVFMEATSSVEMGKWAGILIAETGCAEMPDHKVESLYMAPEELNDVMSTAKQAFLNRQLTNRRKNTAMEEILGGEDDEPLYLDLGADMQVIPESQLPKRVAPPPPPPPDKKPGKRGKSDSASSDNPFSPDADSKKKTEKAKRASKKGGKKRGSIIKDNSPGTKEKSSEKQFEKPNRYPKQTPPTSPVETKTRAITVVKQDVISTQKTKPHQNGMGEKEGEKDDKEERKKKELMKQKAEIKTKMVNLSVKKDELNKYIEAATTDRERAKLRMELKLAADEYSKLETEELNLRRMKDGRYDIDSPSNRRPPSRKEKKPIRTGASGNVLAKAQMWEAGGK